MNLDFCYCCSKISELCTDMKSAELKSIWTIVQKKENMLNNYRNNHYYIAFIEMSYKKCCRLRQIIYASEKKDYLSFTTHLAHYRTLGWEPSFASDNRHFQLSRVQFSLRQNIFEWYIIYWITVVLHCLKIHVCFIKHLIKRQCKHFSSIT
jgi:hypothetical protein